MLLLQRSLIHIGQAQIRRVMVSSTTDNKRKMVKIGTHSGSFHCDEALGCFLLRQTDTYRDADIVRTRDESILSGLDVVIDVGGKYDPGMEISHICALNCTSSGINLETAASARISPHHYHFIGQLRGSFNVQLPSALIIIKEASTRSLAMV